MFQTRWSEAFRYISVSAPIGPPPPYVDLRDSPSLQERPLKTWFSVSRPLELSAAQSVWPIRGTLQPRTQRKREREMVVFTHWMYLLLLQTAVTFITGFVLASARCNHFCSLSSSFSPPIAVCFLTLHFFSFCSFCLDSELDDAASSSQPPFKFPWAAKSNYSLSFQRMEGWKYIKQGCGRSSESREGLSGLLTVCVLTFKMHQLIPKSCRLPLLNLFYTSRSKLVGVNSVPG